MITLTFLHRVINGIKSPIMITYQKGKKIITYKITETKDSLKWEKIKKN